MSNLLKTKCPHYNFKDLSLEKVGSCIDEVLLREFKDREVVIRGIQSAKHEMGSKDLVQQILSKGTDRLAISSDHAVKFDKQDIDLYGYPCTIGEQPIVLPVLEGFHKWKPKSLERPKRKVDIWMIYDARQLINVEYVHGNYGVIAKDGYRFKEPAKKTKALLGVIETV